jgi:N-acetylglucosaminyl-diphospho-decaprenol L-rhamnosyltransferase
LDPEARTRPGISAVVVHYGAWEPTLRALASFRAHAPEAALIVVNNGPAPVPAGVSEFGASIIEPGENLGYGAGCNRGAAAAQGDFLLLSNNDVEIEADTVGRLRRRLEADPGLAAVGPRFLDAAGRPRRSVRRSPTPWRVLCENLFLARLPFFRSLFPGHHTVSGPESRSVEVETLLGALVLFRRDAWDAVSGFDERYFFYAEETDLFARLVRGGWRLAFEPAASAVHYEGIASASLPQSELDLWLHRGLLRYAARFHGAAGRRRTALALRAGARLRWLLSFVPGTPARRARRRRYADILALYRDGTLPGMERMDGPP